MKRFGIICFLVLSINNIVIAQYFIVFKAIPRGNGSLAGHAFVSFVKFDNTGKQTIIDATWGFFPVEKTFKALYSEDGIVKPSDIGDLGKVDFIVETDYVTYEYCKKLKIVWNDKRYGAIGTNKNCVDFVKDIARKIIPELNFPGEIYLMPRPFLDRLKVLNYRVDKSGRERLTVSAIGYKPDNSTATVCSRSNIKWIRFADIKGELKVELDKMGIYEDLVSLEKSGCETAVFRTDLDNNGKAGFAIGIVSGTGACCGTLGCQFEVRESDGKNLFYLESDLCGVKIGQGGILTSANRLIKLEDPLNIKK